MKDYSEDDFRDPEFSFTGKRYFYQVYDKSHLETLCRDTSMKDFMYYVDKVKLDNYLVGRRQLNVYPEDAPRAHIDNDTKFLQLGVFMQGLEFNPEKYIVVLAGKEMYNQTFANTKVYVQDVQYKHAPQES